MFSVFVEKKKISYKFKQYNKNMKTVDVKPWKNNTFNFV